MSGVAKKLLRRRLADCGNGRRAFPVRSQRRSFLRTYSAGSLVVALLLALVAPTTTPAMADDGTEHPSLEKRVLSDFFVDGVEVATSAGFPACGSITTKAAEGYPETPYRTCAGEVQTWDGLELDARVSFPCIPKSLPIKKGEDPCDGVTSEPLPLVVILHGWGGNRNGVQGTHCTYNPEDPGWSCANLNHPGNNPATSLSPARFLARGYATLVYTARGWQASCGSTDPAADVIAAGGTDVPSEDGCLNGHTHIAERQFEVADTERLLGRLVDAGVADPQRLAAAGGSYGAGQSWLLATAMPWQSPKGTSLQLAAAVPIAGWTDFYGSIAPNGRATDGLDQRASHEEPFGVAKPVYLNTTYVGGRSPISGGRYNTTNPAELHSYFDGWAAVFNAGEPHDTDQAKLLPAALRGKSAYYSDEYLNAVAARRVRPVPIFAVQGWTDPFFPAVETLQMYRKLKASHPGYPINVLLGDIGHNAQNPLAQGAYAWEQAGYFIDTHLGVETDGLPVVAASFPTLCAVGDHVPLTADTWDTLVRENPLTFSSDDYRATNSWSSNIGEEVASDPVLASTDPLPDGSPDPFPNSGACVERDANASASGVSWQWTVNSEFTMLGLPSVSLPYAMDGQDGTVVAKLWDVGPDGKKLLVTRGVYRLSVPDQPTSGVAKFQLFGNHWRFLEGHTIELELGQQDRPLLRPNNLPSSIAYDGVELSLPQAKN